jgi:hypothetical protein
MDDGFRMLMLRVMIVFVLYIGPRRPAGRPVELKAW